MVFPQVRFRSYSMVFDIATVRRRFGSVDRGLGLNDCSISSSDVLSNELLIPKPLFQIQRDLQRVTIPSQET